MAIYGSYANRLIESQQSLNEAGYISDIPKYIKKLINDYKKKKKDEKDRQEKIQKFQKEQEARLERLKKYKQEFDNLSAEEKKKVMTVYDKKVKEFESLAKSELSKLMKDKQFIQSLKDGIKDWYKKGNLTDEEYEYYKNYIPPVHVDNQYDYWEIIDSDQDESIMYSDIVYELAKRLEKISGYSIGTGDGDEGCIYPEELMDLFTFYINVYKKEA